MQYYFYVCLERHRVVHTYLLPCSLCSNKNRKKSFQEANYLLTAHSIQTKSITLIHLQKIIQYLPSYTIMEVYATIPGGDDKLPGFLSCLDFCHSFSHQLYFYLLRTLLEFMNPIPLQTAKFCSVFAIPYCNSNSRLISADFFFTFIIFFSCSLGLTSPSFQFFCKLERVYVRCRAWGFSQSAPINVNGDNR